MGEGERAAYGRALLAVNGGLYSGSSIFIVVMAVGCTFTNPSSSSSKEESINGEIESNLTRVDGIVISNLAPEEELLSSEIIAVSKNESEVQYALTYSHSGVTLVFGLRGADGTEYRQTVTGGSIVGSFCDVPIGTYQLFVRNVEALSDLPNYQEKSESYLADGVINLYQVGEASPPSKGGDSCAAPGYPGASSELNPINWTFSQADVPILTDPLKRSEYLALYMDRDLSLRITSDRIIEISNDGGLTWSTETYNTINWEDFSVWLLENEPLPNFSMRDLQERSKNGAEVRHMALDQGKEIYFVLDDSRALLELVQEEKIQAPLLDGQRLVLTSTSSRLFLFSKTMFDSFRDLLKACNLINSRESENEWSDVIKNLNEYGANFS